MKLPTVIKKLHKVPGWLLDKLSYAYQRYPAQTLSVLAAGVVYGASIFGIVVPKESALSSLGYVLPILLAGRVVHNKVEPVKKKGLRKPTPLAER